MKNILLVGALLFLFSCSNKSKLISKNWKMQEMDIAGQNLSGDAVSGFSMDIKEDGTYKLVGMTEEEGTWKISDNGDSLITTTQKGVTLRNANLIKELTEQKLSVQVISEGTTIMMLFVPQSK